MNAPARWWERLEDGRVRCDLCPRACALSDGQRGFCFVRQNVGSELVLTTYGRSSGFVLDPIEKKPLNHFLPGSSVLSFGTAGCNLGCKFCQNWDISKSKQMDTLADAASPARIAQAARDAGAESIAFTYNDPTIFAEYAIDTAEAAHALGIRTVAVTAGYISAEPRREFYRVIDAANVDLKAFSEDFYFKITGAHLAPVLETLRYLVHETSVWTEITTLLIPGYNDSDAELERLSRFVAEELKPSVPLHFSAFHPDYKLIDVPRTPHSTLRRARSIAQAAGLKHVYTGNVHDLEGDTTTCSGCGAALIERDWYEILAYRLGADGKCEACGTKLEGVFNHRAGAWGRRRERLRL